MTPWSRRYLIQLFFLLLHHVLQSEMSPGALQKPRAWPHNKQHWQGKNTLLTGRNQDQAHRRDPPAEGWSCPQGNHRHYQSSTLVFIGFSCSLHVLSRFQIWLGKVFMKSFVLLTTVTFFFAVWLPGMCLMKTTSDMRTSHACSLRHALVRTQEMIIRQSWHCSL